MFLHVNKIVIKERKISSPDDYIEIIFLFNLNKLLLSRMTYYWEYKSNWILRTDFIRSVKKGKIKIYGCSGVNKLSPALDLMNCFHFFIHTPISETFQSFSKVIILKWRQFSKTVCISIYYLSQFLSINWKTNNIKDIRMEEFMWKVCLSVPYYDFNMRKQPVIWLELVNTNFNIIHFCVGGFNTNILQEFKTMSVIRVLLNKGLLFEI